MSCKEEDSLKVMMLYFYTAAGPFGDLLYFELDAAPNVINEPVRIRISKPLVSCLQATSTNAQIIAYTPSHPF